MSEPDLTPQEPGTAPNTDTAKLEAIAAGSVGDLVEGLDALTTPELDTLLAIEQQGKGRTTALGAIQREIESRRSGADNEPETPANDRAPLGDAQNYAEMRARDVDATKLDRPVLTLDGWLLPNPQAQAGG